MSISPWTRHFFAHSLRLFLGLAATIATILFVLIGSNTSFAQATNFAIGTTVQQQNVQRLGVNLGGQDYWDSGQMLRNVTIRNPGFEGQQWQTAIDCVTATATSCTDANTWNVWTANILAGATFEVVNGPAQGETGTISSNTISAYAAGNTTNPNYGMTITFSSPLAVPLAAGDFIIVRMLQPGNAQAGWWTDTGGGGTLSTETTDIAPDSPGKQALEMSASSSGQSASVTSYFDTYSGRSFLQLNGSYTLTFRAKGLGGNNQLAVMVDRLATQQGVVTYLSQNVNLAGQWQDYSFSFTANEDGTYIGPVQVSFSAAGASLELDDVALTEAAASDNPTAYRNAVVDRLRQLRPGVLRLMVPQDLGSTIDNELAVPFARMRSNFNSQSVEEDDIPMGLHEFLVLCQAVGAEPWFTMSGEISATDMQHLIEYLGGDASTPYGAIRASLGQSQPWTSVFPVIHLELGNEMWNPVGEPGEQINDPVAYGQRAAVIFGAARSSPSYNSSSFDLVMGSQAANPWWTQQEMQNSSGYDSVDAAPYLFDTFSDYSSNEAIFGPMFAQPEQTDSTSNSYMAQQLQTAVAGSPPAKLEIYEVNLGTQSGTAPQAMVNQVVGGVGAGITVADHALLMMRDLGITVQNIFALTEIDNGFTNTATGASETMPLWGTTIDMGGETNANRPTFLAEELANSAILPTMLSVSITGANPTWNQPLSANDTVNPIQLANAHYLQSFAFTDGTHYSIIVFNLSRSGSLPITFSGANAPAGNVLISQLTSQNPTDNNEGLTSAAPVVNTTQQDASGFNPATPYSLPPFSMTVFSWPGSALPATTTTLGANPTSVAAGAQVALTATVTSQSGSNTPTGAVTFMNGATTLGTGTLNSSGVATLNTSALPAGTDSITASYGGDSNNAGSVSPAVTVTITSSAVPTTTALTASPMQANTGQSVTLTATVTPNSGSTAPQGTVNFLNGTTSLGSATLNASGVATLSSTSLPAGADSITAAYAGNNNDAVSTSSAVAVNVTQTVAATTTVLTASATQTAPGQSVTFMATVTPQSGSTPTGTVTFLDGATTLGTGTLNSNGAASFSTSSLPSGTDSITASYAGTTSDSASISPAVTVTVGQGAVTTATTLTSSATSINTGQSVTFTAKVVQQSGTAMPSGAVAFLNGSTILGTANLNSSGVAAFSTTALPGGSDSITASYGGATGFDNSVSAAVAVTVKQTLIATTATLSASASQINTGQSVTFTATVAPQTGTTTPTGTVTFLDGTTSLGTATLNAGGVASLSATTLASGNHSITASYGGSTTNSSSISPAVAITVNQTQVATTTALAASPTSITTGQSVTLTATVAPQTGTTVPAGTVTFFNGGAVLGTATLNGSGAAALTTRSLPAGSDSITASYGGGTGAASSTSPAVVVTVSQSVIATTTALAVSATQITSGQSLTLTATVTPQTGTTAPTGSVTFADGSTTLATVPLSNGTASFSTSSLAAGNHSITASYVGSTSDSASTSTPVSIQVAAAPVHTTTALSASATAIKTGQSVTFTATVVPNTSGATLAILPVAFLDGSAIIGTANVNSSGVATFTTTSLPAGSDSITASYTGNTVDLSSVSNPLTVTVTQTVAATTTLLTASSTQITTGQSVTFSAKVTAPSGTPTGSVTFLDGSTPLGTGTLNPGGTAFFATSALAAGNHSITASYGGDQADAASVSPAVPVVVSASQAATTTALAASATAANTGQNVTFTATVSAKTGGTVPAGTVAFLDGGSILGSATLNASGAATFTTTALPAGTQSITASYGGSTANSSSVSGAVTVVVTQTVTSTTTTLAASAAQIGVGDNVVLTATVLPGPGGATPTGSLTLTDGSTILGTEALNGSGVAFFSTSSLALGAHEITASYGGSSSESKSVSAQVTVTVVQTVQPTSTSLATSAAQIAYGSNVALTATVSQQLGGAVSSGSVAFLDGSTILASAPLNASGVAVLNTRTLGIGAHSITASFVGNSGDSSSSSTPVSISILPSQGTGQSSTTIALTASAAQVTSGQSLTFTATLASGSSSYSLSGSVMFLDGSNAIGTAPISGSGLASLSTSTLSVGTHSITAVYGGNDQTAGAVSSPVSVVVQQAASAPAAPAPTLAATRTTLASSASQVTAGDPITFTATVADQTGSGMPGGTVQFLDGSTVLGPASLTNGGTATLTTSSLAVGTHSITANYEGDSSNGVSSSAAVSVAVAAAGTPGYTMSVSASDVSVEPGQVANLTVTVTPENGFNMPVNLTCQSPLAGTTCSFSPPTITPNGGPVTSTLSIVVASSSDSKAENQAPPAPFDHRMALGMVMPWGIFFLLGLSRRKNRSRAKAWSIRLIIAAALAVGSLWVSGCGYQANSSAFTMTLTSSGANVPTHTSQVIVNVLQ